MAHLDTVQWYPKQWALHIICHSPPEISSCLVKHTEVTQKYISELTELKKSKDYMQPEQNTFLYFLPIFRLG
uniref:Uncharacterized protein n=1 Tax=Catharus ustulatus TaxID=91951 RepID=A0A8C3UPR9_CATUS